MLAKEVFGGTGMNFVNPALAARAFVGREVSTRPFRQRSADGHRQSRRSRNARTGRRLAARAQGQSAGAEEEGQPGQERKAAHTFQLLPGRDVDREAREIVAAVKGYAYLDQAPVQRVDVREGLEQTLVIMRHRLRDAIEVVREFADDMPEIEVRGSELNQVWTNLIDNAVDAMENAEKRVLKIETKKDDKYVVVNITDSGNGIPEDVVDKIFEPFFTTTPMGRGTGLGLEVVHQIVTTQHSGNIMVNSQPGNTTFTVYIPVKPE